jgi:hypothetical protein
VEDIMSFDVSGSQIRKLVLQTLSAADLKSYRTTLWVNAAAFAVALALMVVVLVLSDADLRGGEVLANSAGAHSGVVTPIRK